MKLTRIASVVCFGKLCTFQGAEEFEPGQVLLRYCNNRAVEYLWFWGICSGITLDATSFEVRDNS